MDVLSVEGVEETCVCAPSFGVEVLVHVVEYVFHVHVRPVSALVHVTHEPSSTL